MATMNVNVDEKVKVPELNIETIKAIEDAEKGIGLSKGYTYLKVWRLNIWKDMYYYYYLQKILKKYC